MHWCGLIRTLLLLLFQNVTGYCSTDSLSITQVVTVMKNTFCGANNSGMELLLLFQNVTGHCSTDSLSITQVVNDMKNTFCGANNSGMELHIMASVLQTYHNMAVQAASIVTDAMERTRMQIISEMLRGLVLDYFRVVRKLCLSVIVP